MMKEYRIEEISTVVAGGTPSTKVADYWNGNIIWLTPKDLSNSSTKWIYDSANTITESGLQHSSAQMLPTNSVLLSSRAPIGYLAIAGKPLCTNQGFKSMICNENIVLPEYLYYYLQTKVEDFNNISTGSTFKELSASLLKSYKVNIHDLEFQQHIVDILGTLDEKIENNNSIIENLLNNLQLQYVLCFLNRDDLPHVPLLFFVENTLGGDWGKEQPEKNYSEEVVCIRGADIPDISSGQNGTPPRRFILKKNLQAKELLDYEIIVEISGGSPTQSTGRSALITQHLIDQYNAPLICTNFCRAIRCKNKIYAAYVYSAFSQMYNDNLFFNYENGTTGIKNLDLQAILENEEIALPSEEELKAFFTLTNDTLIQVMRFREENNKLNELKQLYLKKFFG